MVEIRGWRRADYHAERMAFDKQKWERECQKEVDAEEEKEEELACRKITAWLFRFLERKGHRQPWIDDIHDSRYDLDLLHELRKRAWKVEDAIAAKKAAEKSPESAVRSPKFEEKGGKEENEKGDIEPAKAGEGEPVTCSVQPSTAAGLANGEKPAVDNQGLVHPVTVGNSEKIESPDSGLSDAERKEFYKKYLGMLLDLNAAGEDLRELGGYADAERKHAALRITPEVEVQSSKSGKVEANFPPSTFNVQHSGTDSDCEMSSEERREIGARALEMLCNLFQEGEDILGIASHDELLKKHEALKAKKEQTLNIAGKSGDEHDLQQGMPQGTGDIQSPIERGNGKEEKAGESANSQPATQAHTPNSKHQASENLQTSGSNQTDDQSFNDPQFSSDPDLRRAEIEKVMELWRRKARNVGIHPPGTSSLDYALLRVYLSGEPCAWEDTKRGRVETAEPPARDPRRDPASIWYQIAQKWEAARRAGQV
jgi:hypothetical protein